jgi:hypothetical protein
MQKAVLVSESILWHQLSNFRKTDHSLNAQVEELKLFSLKFIFDCVFN